MIKSNRNRIFLTGCLYLLMFSYAISATIIGPLIPYYIQEFGLSLSEGGLITAFQGVGGVMAIIAGIFFVDRVTKSMMITLTFSTYCLAVFLILLSQIYAAIIILFFIIGASTKMLDAVLNAYIADLNPAKRTRNVNWLHASFGFGALTGPLISSAFLNSNIETNIIFLTLGLFCLSCFLLYLFAQRGAEKELKYRETAENRNIMVYVKNRKVRMLACLCFLYTGLSTSISTWMPATMQGHLGSGTIIASLSVSFLWVGIIIGRLLFSVITVKIDLKKVLLFSNLIGSACWMITMLISNEMALMIACGISGLSSGAIIPLSVSAACDEYPCNTGSVSSFIFLFVTIGYMLIPWLVGVLAEVTSLWRGMWSMGVILLLISILYGLYSKNDKRADSV